MPDTSQSTSCVRSPEQILCRPRPNQKRTILAHRTHSNTRRLLRCALEPLCHHLLGILFCNSPAAIAAVTISTLSSASWQRRSRWLKICAANTMPNLKEATRYDARMMRRISLRVQVDGRECARSVKLYGGRSSERKLAGEQVQTSRHLRCDYWWP